MTYQAFSHLQDMVDRLVPNMWLRLDQPAFERCFGIAFGEGPDSKEAIEAAKDFAKRNGLSALIDHSRRSVEFGRSFANGDVGVV